MSKRPHKIKYYAAKAVRGNDEIMVAAGDVETEGLGGKLLMVQWGFMGQVFTSSSPTMVEEFFAFASQVPSPVIWYFHFGQYDWRYFLDYFVENEIEINIGMRSDTDIYQIKFKNDEGKWCILRDSYALWPSSLEKLADAFCPEIPKMKIDIENFDPHNPEHIKYAKRDIEILLAGMPRLFDMMNEHFNINAGATTAGTALKAWQKSLPDKAIFDCSTYDAQEIFIRQSYYGGLVFLTSTKMVEDAETYDINSSYPDSMERYGVPYGRAIATTDYQSNKMGIYRCRVRAPDDVIVPIIPARNEKGAMRWYKGEFDTVCTNVELIFAAKHGYEILEVYEGIVFEETVFPFNDFIGYCKWLRSQFRGLSQEALAKLMQNSLYGKFGARRDRTRMQSAHSMAEDDFIDATPYDEEGHWYITKEFDEDMPCLPAWAVFITAHSRIKLLNQVYKIGAENVLYGDTDSITVKAGYGHLVDQGLEYGQWKLEKKWKKFRAIAPKVYAGVLEDGTFMGAAKGLPRKGITDKNWNELLEDGHSKATTLSLPSLRVAMKKGVSAAVELTRKSSNLDNSSNYYSLPDGNVRVKFKHEK